MMMKIRMMKILFCASLLAAALPNAASAQTVTTTVGALQGARQGEVNAFLGIPYAKPPVGDFRWRSPEPVSWTGTRLANTFGPSCPQREASRGYRAWTPEYMNQTKMSEDCLYLNVWTTATGDTAKKPVLVWIHGGGFNSGSGSVPIYDGANLAKRGVVVVTINYRLGVLGFLAHPELTREAGSSGNYAIQDMIAALKWVKANISAFGGDPAQVTIAGQSAGASSVFNLIAAPDAKGLFARAIAQSGLGIDVSGSTLAAAEADGVKFMQAAGVQSVADLRRLSVERVSELAGVNGNPAAAKFRFVPIVDGKVIPHALNDLHKGDFSDTPVLAGQVADEGSMMVRGYGVSTLETLKTRISTEFGELGAQANALYPATDDTQAGVQSKALGCDNGLASALQWVANRQQNSSKPIYLYLFDHVEPGPDSALYGTFHSSDIPYVLQTLDKAPNRPFTAADFELSRVVSTYWLNFVRTGNPNGAGLPTWPAVKASQPEMMRLGATPAAEPALPTGKLRLYQNHIAHGGHLSIF